MLSHIFQTFDIFEIQIWNNRKNVIICLKLTLPL